VEDGLNLPLLEFPRQDSNKLTRAATTRHFRSKYHRSCQL